MLRRYPALYLLVWVVAGIIIAELFKFPSIFFLVTAMLLAGVAIYVKFKNKLVLTMLLLGGAILFYSSFNYNLRVNDPGLTHISNLINDKIRCRLFGEIKDWPKLKTNRTEIPLDLDSIFTDKVIRTHGKILIKLSDTSTVIQRGDKLELYGTIYPVRQFENSTGFDYGRYLQIKGLFGIVYLQSLLNVRIEKSSRFDIFNFVHNLRKSIRDSFYRNLSPPSASLASGFLIGETRNIDADVYRYFRDSGTLHLLAVSGSNVALVILFFITILKPFSVSRNQRSLILIIVIFLFIFVSYSEPSVIRAGLMASIIILAGIIQRKYDLNNVIALTALLILLIEPAQFFEVGFQLSFVTAWGIILAVPIYEDIIKRYRLSRWSKYLFMIFAVSLTAQLFSAPLIILYFKQIPLYSLAANIIIVPLVSIALFGILALLIVDLILPILGQFLGGVLNYFLLKIVTVIEFFGANDNSVIEVGKLSVINLLFCYLFLVGLIFAYKSIKVRRCLLILLLLFLNIIFFSKLFSEDINTQQQAVVCKIPGGEILFLGDGDKSCDIIVTNCHGTDYPIDEYIINPFLKDKGISKIDNMIILSSQYDGLKGLINVAVEFEAEVIHISKGLEQSFKDISLSLDSYHDKFSVNLLKPLSKVKPEIGYYPLSNGMFVNSIYFKGLIITNIDGFDAQLENFSAPIDLLLLSNQRYDLSEMNILEISDKYKYIICSKIKQNFNIGLFNQKGHSNIIDLNQYRIFRVK